MCVCVHVHFCVFTFISPSVCAWKCVPGIVCLYKQMDENLRLLRSPSPRLSFFFSSLPHSRWSELHKRKTTLSISSERLSPLTQNARYLPSLFFFLLIWDDVQQSRVFFLSFLFCFLFPLRFSFSPCGFGFAYYPRHDGESVQNTEGSSSNKPKSFVRLFK